MKKTAFYIVVTLWCTAPVFAAPSHTSATFPANGFMLEDYTYTNAATATNMAGVYEYSVNANPNYNDCLANSWCDASGQHACSTAGDGSYTSSAAGANENTACYKSCTVATANIAHATAVSGNDYYGAGTDTCSATSCENGYHVYLIDVEDAIGTATYSDQGNLSNSGTTGSNNAATFGLTENGTFGVSYVDNKGTIKGRSQCSTQSGTGRWTNPAATDASEITTLATLPDSTGQYCYCTVDEYIPVDGSPMSLSGPWVFRRDTGSANNCANYCASGCASDLGNSSTYYMVFRTAVLGSAVGSMGTCEITDITVGPGYYLPAGTETVATCPAGSYCPGLPNPVHYDANNNQGLFSCPTGYTYNTDTGKTSASQCQISCAAGTWVGEYTLLEYIETTGTQYIDTGVNVSTLVNPLVTATLQYTSTAKSQQNGARTRGYYFLFGISGTSNNFTIQAGGGGTETLFGTNDTNKHTFVIDTVNATCAIDDDVRTLNVGDLSGLNQTIFIGNTSGENRFNQARFFNVNIVSGGVVIMNLVPAQRNSDGAVGMYDMVTGAFFTNAGTGTFTAGADAGIGTLGNCVNVGAGYYSAASVVNYGSSGTRNACPIGTSTNGATNASSCTTCTGATYAATTASATCTACPSGYTHNTTSGKTAATQCQISCAAGTYVATAGPNVPSEYIELEYIEATGTQWIDTGIIPDVSTVSQIGITMSGTTRNVVYGYAYGNVNHPDYRLINDQNKIGLQIGFTLLTGEAGSFANNTYYEFEIGNRYVKDLQTDLVIVSDTAVSDVIIEGSLKVFRGYGGQSSGKIYFLKIFQNGSLVRNLVPARRVSDDALGMYDTVTNTFFTNAGTGDFTAGPAPALGCVDVGAGYYSAASVVNHGSSGTRTACPIGTSTNGVTNASSCTTCAGATYAATTASGTCTACPSGYTHNTTSGKNAASQCQIQCPAGTYLRYADTVPDGYTQLQYIETTGTSYIKTGVFVENLTNPIMLVDAQLTTVDANYINDTAGEGACLAGQQYTYGNFRICIDAAQWRFESSANYNSESYVPANMGPADTNRHVFVLDAQHATAAVDGNTAPLTVNNLTHSSAHRQISVGGANRGSANQVQWVPQAKYYHFNLISDGVDVLNMIPARRDSDNAVGMYDTVNGVFYPSDGTDPFIAGPVGNGCTNVGAGYYAGASVVNYGSAGTRTACPVGTSTNGVTNASSCTTCTGATYAATTASGTCTDCPTGYTYNTDTGKTSASQCQIQCPVGTYLMGFDVSNGYTPLEYIETTGTQYIDTGVNVSTLVNPLVTVTLQYTSTARGQQNGARGSSNYFVFGISNSSDKFTIQAGGGGSETLFGTTDTNKHTFVIDTVNATCAIDDDVRTLRVGNLSGLNQTIFIGNTSGQSRFDQARFFNVNIVSGGVVIMNLVPAQRNSDGVDGMYDTVTGAFFTNAGVGTFVPGFVGSSCFDVGAGYWSSGGITNYGSGVARNACPVGTTTVGYGHGADEATDCGRIMHFGNSVIYARSNKVTTPSLNIKLDNNDVYYISLSPTNHTLSRARVGSGDNKMTLYDDSLFYGERDFTTGERIVQ